MAEQDNKKTRRSSSRVPGEGSAAGRNQPPPPGFYYQTSKVSQVSQPELVRQLAALMRPEFREYLTTGRHLSPVQSLDSERMFLEEGVRQLTAAERQFLDRVRQDPTSVNVQEFRNFAIPGEWTAADPDAPNRQPSVSERISNLLLGERQEQRRFEQSSLEEPDVELGPNQSLQWYGAENAWGIVEGEAGRVPKFLRLLTNEETRRGMLLSPATPSARTPTAGPAQERQVIGTPSSAAQPPSKQLPEGQQYVFNRGLNRWEVMDSRGRTIGAVDRAGNIVQPTTGRTEETTSSTATTIPGVEMAPATGVIPEDWEQAAKEQYGAYWAIFQYQPELQQLLIDATREGWDPSKFQYQLEQTGWWKTTTESARLFDMEEATDPATVQTKIDNQVAAINQIALGYGVRLSSETAAKIARDSLRGGWATNPALMQTAITNEATKSTAGVSQLRAGYIGQQIRGLANTYGINLGDAELNSWVQKWASGAENQQSVTAAMQEWSKVLYPSISQYIDQGRTFQDVVAPYKSIAAGLLEMDPEQINFTEPKWLAAISKEDKAGQQKLMSATEWQREIRTNRDFGFEFTKQAKDQAYLVANQMAELFGRV